MSENEFYKNPENVYGLLGVDPIEMEFGYSLIPLVDEKKGGSFIDRVVMLRRQFAVEMGMVVPSVRLRDNMGLGPNDYVIKLRGEEIARGQVLADHFLAMNPGNVIEEVAGIDTVEPAFGIPARWVAAEMRETAQMSGYTIIDPLSVLVTHLSELIKKHAHELLGRREIGALLEHVRKTHKDLVNDLIPSVIGMGELQKVLCNLLAEQIPIRDMVTILETLSEFAPTVKDADILTEYVRQALRRTITRKFTDAGRLRVLTVNPELENIIMGGVKKTEHGSYVAIEPETMQKIASAHMREMDRLQQTGASPVVLTSPLVRVYYKKLLEQFNQSAVVLSFSEIDPAIHIQSLGTISVQGVLSRA
jgi:flagellar biosynthesis protein FlhA